jgi:hypothetical protein
MAVVPQNFYSFQAAQATASTAQALQMPAAVQMLSAIIKASKANTAAVALGGAGVTMANGYLLEAGEVISMDTAGVGKLYMNSTATGAGATLYVLLVGP